MKMKRIIVLGLWLACVGIAHAVDILKVKDVQITSGESVTLSVELSNETKNFMGWQCDISLPEGLTLELKANGKPAAKLGERFAETEHTISSSRLASGDYRFIATSMDGESIPGTSGILFSVTLKADASLAFGTKLTGIVKNIEFNTQDNQKIAFDNVSFIITTPSDENHNDGEGLQIPDVNITASESHPINILLNNSATNLMGWQCDISLPEGLTLELKANGKPAAKLGERFAETEHTISSSRLASGDYRFIATSMDGESIPGTSGILFSVTLKADASLAFGTKLTGIVKNIEFNTQDNQKITFDNVTFTIYIVNTVAKVGDVNGDGNINIADAVCIVNYVVGKPNTAFNEAASDVNDDGKVTLADAVEVIKICIGEP